MRPRIALFDLKDLATGVVADRPVVCSSCGEPRRIFVNRNGTTRCLVCDGNAVRGELAAVVMMQRSGQCLVASGQ